MKNKVIVVTGGSGLLGDAMIKHLRARGTVAVNLDINCADVSDSDEIHCDVTSVESLNRAMKMVIEKYGHIDGLVNNAYPRTADWGSSFEDTDPASWRNNVDWQLNSHAFACMSVIGHMKERGGGSIVNIASIYGVVGNDFNIYEGTPVQPVAAYSAIKGGIISLTRFLASQYGKYNIRVNSVAPGGIFDNQPEAFVRAYEQKVPMKRMGRPDDIAPAVTFLLSDEAKYITGHNLIVDGGWTAI